MSSSNNQTSLILNFHTPFAFLPPSTSNQYLIEGYVAAVALAVMSLLGNLSVVVILTLRIRFGYGTPLWVLSMRFGSIRVVDLAFLTVFTFYRGKSNLSQSCNLFLLGKLNRIRATSGGFYVAYFLLAGRYF